MNPYILVIVGAMGLVGCLILLFMGLSMMREERSPKQTPVSGAGAIEPVSALAASSAAPGPSVAVAPVPSELGAPTSGATTSSAPSSSAANPFAGLATRLSGARTRGSAHEVLRVLRDNLTGRVLIEIAGRRYPNLGDIQDEAVRAGLLTTLHDLEAFAGTQALETTQQLPAARPVTTAVELSPAVEQPAAPRLAPEPRRPIPAADAPAVAGAVAAARPLPPPTMNPFKQMAVLRAMAKNPLPEPKSIAEQIDEVLQIRITSTTLAQRIIHMRPGPRGDAVFEVDGQSYTAVDEVPDESVRDLIRAAINEWEHSQ